MPTVSNNKTNGSSNGNLSGHSNGSIKQSGGPPPPTKSRMVLSKKFNALFAFTFLGAIWAAMHLSASTARTYALCSQDGDRIYTVDANNTNVACVVVRDAHILDTGSLCQ